jgi:hypothetical protein
MGMDFNDSHVLVLTNIRRNKNKYIVRKSKQNKISMMQNLAARVLAVDDPFQSFIYTEKMLLIFYASRLTFRYFKVLRVASIILTFSAKHTKLRTLIRKMYRQDTNENITGLVQQSPKCRVGNPISVQKSM